MESLLQFKGEDLTMLKQEAACGRYYHGHGNIISQIEKFVGGRGKFSNFWMVEDTTHGPLRIIPQALHRQRLQVFAADKNVTAQLLSRASLTKRSLVSGRTIRMNAMATIRSVKKMLSLVDEAVKENILAKEGTEYDFCSGKNLTDFTDFIIYRMYHWDKFDGASGAGIRGDEAPVIGSPENKDDNSLNAHPLFQVELAVPADSTDDAVVATDEVSTPARTTDGVPVYEEPPAGWFPHGFMYFMARGPIADVEFREDFLSLDQYLEGTGPSRKESRKASSKEKKAALDYELGKGELGRNRRGLALGAASQKEIAVVAMNQSKIHNQAYDSEIIKCDMLLKSKQGQVNTYMEMAKMYRDMGNVDKARTRMMAAETLMKDIEELSADLRNLANDRASNSVEVTEYLKRGRIGMGIDESENYITPAKKRTIGRKSPETQLDGTEEFAT